MSSEYKHIPVMLDEVLEYLRPQPGKYFIDSTMGGLGYSVEISKGVMPGGMVVAIDLDDMAIANAEKLIKQAKIKNITLVNDNFKNLSKIYTENFKKAGHKELAGVVFDLGLSSAQLEDRNRGFSFQLDDPLDMAFGQTGMDTYYNTKHIVNKWPEKELVRIMFEYGEEKFARKIVREIVFQRKKKGIETTKELVEIIKSVVPSNYVNGKIHFATRTFQALRIATNDELNNLSTALSEALDILSIGGRIVVVSYHSLEDRIVKRFFKEEAKDCICPKEMPDCRCNHQAKLKIITKKIVTPSPSEIKNNPRARSAKLRVAEKL